MLRTRLYLGLLPLVLLLAGVGVYSIYTCRQLAGSLSRDLVSNYHSIVACLQMRVAATEMGNALRDVRAGDPLGAQERFNTQRALFTRQLMDESSNSAGTPRLALVSKLDDAFQAYAKNANDMLRSGGIGSLADYNRNESALKAALDAIDNLSRRDAKAAEQTAARVAQLADTTTNIVVAVIIGAVVLAVFLGWRLATRLLGPIKTLTVSAVALGDGELDRVVPEFSGDELGQLARAFNTMAAKLRDYREAMQARVFRTQRTMEATLTSAPDPVFVVDADGTHTVRNPAAEQLALKTFPRALAEPLARVLATGEHDLPTDYSRVITLRAGREDRHYLPRILAIGDRLTEFKGAAIILQDVTKFRLLDDAKTNLVGTVSHELKTPLTSLRMAVYLLLEQNILGLTSTQRELLETARDDADRLLRILDNLLDLARLEAGASALDRREITVGDLVEDVAAEARPLFEAGDSKLDVQLASTLTGATITVDPDRIRHVFMNLLTNAAKYSPPRTTVTLSAAAEPGFVRFGVRDQGGGIAAEHLPLVFDRFFRAPGQEKKTGAGLGLAIAREIVVAHGGSIACTSAPGKGSEFYFVVPAALSASSRSSAARLPSGRESRRVDSIASAPAKAPLR